MKEIPRLFSTSMVKAVLDLKKTQTRRIDNLKKINEDPDLYSFKYFKRNTKKELIAVFRDYRGLLFEFKSPYDFETLIWVKETWSEHNGDILFKANYIENESYSTVHPVLWRPSIFMFKKYARIWLEVTGLDVQRLQDITEEDANAEGVYYFQSTEFETKPYYKSLYSAKELFFMLWDSINGKKFPASLNPWVYAVTFKRIER